MDFLQLLLAINVLILAFSLFWIFHLYGKLRHESSSKHHALHHDGARILSKQEIDAIKQKAIANLETTVNRSIKELETVLQSTVIAINTKTDTTMSNALDKELKAYQTSLQDSRSKIVDESSKLRQEVEGQKKELINELKIGINQARETQMDLFNDRLNDVVSSYLIESLDKNVDLGAQMKYIITSLESHKNDIKKDVLS